MARRVHHRDNWCSFSKKKTGSFSLIPLERIKEAFPKNDDVYSNAREKRVKRREGADDERERESLKKTTCCSWNCLILSKKFYCKRLGKKRSRRGMKRKRGRISQWWFGQTQEDPSLSHLPSLLFYGCRTIFSFVRIKRKRSRERDMTEDDDDDGDDDHGVVVVFLVWSASITNSFWIKKQTSTETLFTHEVHENVSFDCSLSQSFLFCLLIFFVDLESDFLLFC